MGIMEIKDCIRIKQQANIIAVQIYRPEANNSINTDLIDSLISILNHIEKNDGIKVVVLEGLADNFCTGMDFRSAASSGHNDLIDDNPKKFYELLSFMSICSKIVVSKIKGKVNAGGIGIVAASDIVISSEKATFGLSEALFGLLPACVMPFLIRRVGVQKAQWMALITQGISAKRAFEIGLVDEVSENIDDSLRKTLLRITRLETETIKDLKDYMSKLWIINQETQKLAVDKINSLIHSEKIRFNIINFLQNKKFPWEK